MGKSYYNKIFAPISISLLFLLLGLAFPLQIAAQGIIEVDPNLVFISSKVDTASLTLDVEGDSIWTASTTASWIRVLPDSGRGDTLVQVIVDPNPLASIRIDSVFFISQGTRVFSAIVQDPFTCEVPTNLTLADSGVFQSVLAWDSIPGAEGYSLRYRIFGTDNPWTLLDTLTQRELTLTGLTAATRYEWQVQTRCTGSQSAWSSSGDFSTLDPCTPPDSLSSTIFPDQQVGLDWASYAFANTYMLRYREVGIATWTEIGPIFQSDTTLVGLAKDTLYEWQVKSLCANKESEWSSSSEFAILTCAEPMNLVVDSVSYERVQIGWDQVTNVLFYELRYRVQGETTWIEIPQVSATDTTLAGLNSDTTYEWEVRARCLADRSDYVSGPQFSTEGLPAIQILYPPNDSTLRIPFYLRYQVENWLVSFGGRHVEVVFDDFLVSKRFDLDSILVTNLPVGVHEIKVRLVEADNSLPGFQDSVSVTILAELENEFSPNPLNFPVEGDTLQVNINSNSTWVIQDPGADIYVSSLTGVGDDSIQVGLRANSSVQVFRDTLYLEAEGQMDSLFIIQEPLPCTPPLKDSLESIVLGANSAVLRWKEIVGVEHYKIEYRELEDGSEEAWVEVDSVRGNELRLDALKESTSYIWTIRSNCGLVLSDFVDDTFRTEAFCPIPLIVDAVVAGDSSVALSWESNSLATAFQLRYREKDVVEWVESPLIFRIDTLLEGLKVNVTYLWQIRSSCQENFSPWSPVDSFFISSCRVAQNLQVDSLSDTTAIVSWDSTLNAEAYALRYRVSGDIPSPWIQIVPITGVDTTLANLSPDTFYEWEIRTICGGDSTIWVPGPVFQTTGPPSVEITYPEDNAGVGIPFFVRFDIRNWELSQDSGSLGIFVNGADSGRVFRQDSFIIDNLPIGFNSIRVELAENDGSLIGINDSIVVEVLENPSLSISPDFLAFPASGDTAEVIITSDIAWSFLPVPDWVHLESTEGSGNDSILIWVDPNTSFQNLLDSLFIQAGAIRDTLVLFQSRAECVSLSNLRANIVQDTSVELSWDISEQAVGYDLRYKLDDSSTNWIIIDSLIQPVFLLEGLLPDTAYLWQVRSDCGPLTSDWSDTATFQTTAPCFPPENPRVDSVSNTWAELGWDPVELGTSYFIRYRELGSSVWITPVPTLDSIFILRGLELGVEYEWEVRTSCEGNFSSWVPGPNFETLFKTPGCGVPQGLMASQLTDTSAFLSWAPVDSALSYEVRYKISSEDEWMTLGPIFNEDTSLLQLLPNTEYNWSVRVTCNDTISEWAPTESFNTLRDPNFVCLAPSNPQVIFISDSTVRFLWTEAPRAIYYELRYRLAGTDSSWIVQSPIRSLQQDVSGLLPDTLYAFQVRSICFMDELETEWSVEGTFQIPGLNSDCPQPFNPFARTLGERSILFEWDQVSLATFYRVRYRVADTQIWQIVDSINTNSLLLSSLMPGASYEWGISTLCESEVSFFTEGPITSTWKAPLITLASPADSTVISEGDSLTLVVEAFDEDGEVVSVEFFSNGALLAEISGDTVSYNWMNIPRGFYQVFAVATDNNGLTSTSDTITVIIGIDPDNVIVSDFSIQGNEACNVNGQGILFTDASVGATSYLWSFGEGALPDSMATAGPHRVRYFTSGLKTITLRVQNDNGFVDIASKTIEVFITPPLASAGKDTIVCEAATNFQANPVTDGVGAWTVISGPATVESVSDPNSRVTGLRMGNNVFSWRAVNGACESEPDTLVIVRMRCVPKTPSAIIGPDTLCLGDDPGSFIFSVPADTSVDKYIWVTPQGISGRIDSNTLEIEEFSGNGGNILVIAENEIGQSDPVSKFVAVDSCLGGPAPGEFIIREFSAFLKGEQVVLDWTVGFDQEIVSYTVEKSLDTMIFEMLETVDSKKQALSEVKYRVIDDTPLEGRTYYRLKVTDASGNVFYSKIIVLQLGVDIPPGEVSVFPNPISSQPLNVAIESVQAGEIQVIITSGTGQMLLNEVYSINAGFNNLVIDASSWPTGIFYVFAVQMGTEAKYGFKLLKEEGE